MIFHRQWKRRQLLMSLAGLLALVLVAVWWVEHNRLSTGQAVPVDLHPYHQLSYTKLTYQGGNFVGDVYLLDVDSAEITQLTQGGETGSMHWLDRESLLFYERPRGSVVNHFVLNTNRGTVSPIYSTNSHFDTIQQFPDTRRIIMPVYADDGSWELFAYRLIENSEADTLALFDIEDAISAPFWLPDSESLLYETDNQEICLHHVDSNSRNCIPGIQPTLSSDVTEPLVAYTTQINELHNLCIASVANQQFRGITCHNSNVAQFTGLSWRP